ncbi:hypothetical protein GCM10025734_64170 [Kitasatospora paranensis]
MARSIVRQPCGASTSPRPPVVAFQQGTVEAVVSLVQTRPPTVRWSANIAAGSSGAVSVAADEIRVSGSVGAAEDAPAEALPDGRPPAVPEGLAAAPAEAAADAEGPAEAPGAVPTTTGSDPSSASAARALAPVVAVPAAAFLPPEEPETVTAVAVTPPTSRTAATVPPTTRSCRRRLVSRSCWSAMAAQSGPSPPPLSRPCGPPHPLPIARDPRTRMRKAVRPGPAGAGTDLTECRSVRRWRSRRRRRCPGRTSRAGRPRRCRWRRW